MSLANKYRPQTFDTVIGQTHITDILKAQMKSDQKIHHNYLLFGPRGTGKTTAARLLAKALNCLDPKDGNACNECGNCQVINRGTSLDYIEIDAASHTGVDNIREEILDKVPYPPTQLKKKIYVIDEVHMLSKGAFNALLKTIEEPRDNVCFILATTEIHKVPDTIISRCQVFNFKKVGENEMTEHLKEICKKENLNFEQEALSIISKISEGCVRDAVKYIDQISILGDITQEHVSKFLGVASESIIRNFFRLIKDENRKDIFDEIDRIYQSGIDLHQFAKQSLIYIDHNLESDIDFLLKVSESFSEIISSIRYYPYPAIVYKIVFNKHLGKKSETAIPVKEADVEIKNENINTEEKKIDIENKGVVNESIKTEVIKVESPSIAVVEKESKLDNSNSRDSIRDNVLSKISKISLQQNLKGNFIIEAIEGNIVNAIVINKMTKILLDNEENYRMLENAFTSVLGVHTKIEINFENKESYFARKMF
ncbi:DNA polymerase III subunit gamma/tau [Candidatus Gracilibacteria bacterium]|nr:DNA polymerase III subunit gamma/tau [Candidatus Gracilibacteria bacterium]